MAPFYPEAEKGYPAWTSSPFLPFAGVDYWQESWLSGERGWLLTGWFWYLGMLTPMIGLVQAGAFAHADRITYLPQIGLYLMLTWTVAELSAGWPGRRVAMGGLAAIILVALMLCAHAQTAYWRDTETLWTHALACTTGNDVANNNFGSALLKRGSVDEAIPYFQTRAANQPGNAEAHNNLGSALFQKGRVDEAITSSKRRCKSSPTYAASAQQPRHRPAPKGRSGRSHRPLPKALQIKPDYAAPTTTSATLLVEKGRVDEAIGHYQKALQSEPDYANAHNNLGVALCSKREEWTKPSPIYQQALQIKPTTRKRTTTSAPLYSKRAAWTKRSPITKGRWKSSPITWKPTTTSERILSKREERAKRSANSNRRCKSNPPIPEAQNNLAWLLATCADASLRNGNGRSNWPGRPMS